MKIALRSLAGAPPRRAVRVLEGLLPLERTLLLGMKTVPAGALLQVRSALPRRLPLSMDVPLRRGEVRLLPRGSLQAERRRRRMHSDPEEGEVES